MNKYYFDFDNSMGNFRGIKARRDTSEMFQDHGD